MPVAEITTLVTSAKAAYEIAKGIGSLKAEVERNQAVSQLLQSLLLVQSDALAMQAEHYVILQEKAELERRVAQFEKWSETEQEYELAEMGPQVFVYRYKQAGDHSKPNHWLCPSCWEDRVKSILQCTQNSPIYNNVVYTCPKCKTSFAWDRSYRGKPGIADILGA